MSPARLIADAVHQLCEHPALTPYRWFSCGSFAWPGAIDERNSPFLFFEDGRTRRFAVSIRPR
jgi:hypothetical protein